jgi:hypothetical protein
VQDDVDDVEEEEVAEGIDDDVAVVGKVFVE